MKLFNATAKAPVVPVVVAPVKKPGCLASIAAAFAKCFGKKPVVVAPVAPKVMTPAPKAKSGTLLKTAIAAGVLLGLAGVSFAAYKNIPAVQNFVNSFFSQPKQHHGMCYPHDKEGLCFLDEKPFNKLGKSFLFEKPLLTGNKTVG